MYEQLAVRQYGPWVTLSPEFSSGSASSMPNSATATVAVDLSLSGAREVEVAWEYTNGGSAPTGNVIMGVYLPVSDSQYATTPTHLFSGTDAANTAMRLVRRLSAADRMQLVLTNQTGQSITSVAIRMRIVRG